MALGGREVTVWLSTAIVILAKFYWGGHLILAALNFHVWHIPFAGKTMQHVSTHICQSLAQVSHISSVHRGIRLVLTSSSEKHK